MRNGTPSSDSNRVARNDQRRRQLAALEFIRRRFDLIENVVDELRFVTRCDDLFRRSFLLEIKFKDRIKLVIRGQRLIVELSWREFSRRSLVDDRLGND